MSLIGAPIIALGETGDAGRRTGMYFSVLCFGALAGPPVSGAIADVTGGYKAVGEYAGTFLKLFDQPPISCMYYREHCSSIHSPDVVCQVPGDERHFRQILEQ